MPRALADAYFRLEPGFPARPTLEAFGPPAAPGGPDDPDAVVRACHLFGQASWQRVFDRAFHGRYGASNKDHRYACCEGRLTWRLLGRRAPVVVTPFPFAFRGWGDPLRRMNRSVVC